MTIETIIKKMTVADKIALCSGKDGWKTKRFKKYGIPEVMVADGPNGLRKPKGKGDMIGTQESEPATCFPTASIVACSFDKELLWKYGQALAEETGAANVATILGPGVNMKRNPLCGRNFEYFSEDPYLAGKLAASYINGVQEKGIGTSLKHFACNNQEYFRMTSDSLVDERTLREMYLPAFEIAVKEGKPATIMAAYNLVNGEYCCSSSYLLNDILRDEWGFEGLVVTDWTAVEDRTVSFQSGCDLVMPGGNAFGEKEALKHVKDGLLSIEDIDKSASRVLKFVFDSKKALDYLFYYDAAEHHKLSCHIAEQSAVLLKNEDDILPLASFSDTVFLGHMAESFRYQGYGSSKVNPTKIDQVVELEPNVPYAKGYEADGSTNDELIAEAVSLAKDAKQVIIFVGLPGIYESEGFDREDMKMPLGHLWLIDEITKHHANIIVVLCGGAVMEIPWADKVKAILYMGLSGQAGAQAALNLLTGAANPSGRLAETWPMQYSDCPNSDYYLGEHRNAEYREGIYIGYRYYDKAKKSVRYPFGHGLSYTTFAYQDFNVDEENQRVTVTVMNIGDVAGSEVVQLYVFPPQNGIHRPIKELKGFDKVYLQPGESVTVSFMLDQEAYRAWHNGWTIFEGEYELAVGGTSTDLYCRHKLFVSGEKPVVAMNEWYDHLIGVPNRDEWLKHYGKAFRNVPIKPYHINSNLQDMMADSWIIRFMYKQYEKQQAKQFGYGSADYKGMMIMADECPVRSIQNNLNAQKHFALALADLGNKKFFSAIKHFIM